MSKILLIRPKSKNDTYPLPHVGLAMLSSVLKEKGHQVKVLDYLLFINSKEPDLKDTIQNFNPDVIGISIYTSTLNVCNRMMDEIYNLTDKPILVGGPHPSIYTDELVKNKKISYIFKGESELTINEIINNAKKQDEPVVVETLMPDVTKLPLPDFTSFINYTSVTVYPLLTSRGCPFGCSFCVVKYVSSQKWRMRDYKVCVDELEQAKKLFPNLRLIKVSDDCPTFDLSRFKSFLKEYINRKIDIAMTIDNTRADRIDEEFVQLAKKANNTNLCVGAEHGDAEVFDFIGKSETLETIKNAARTIKKNGLELRLCFIIGLPKDNLKRIEKSIGLAKELGAFHIYWNMVHPMKGTKIRKWFEENNAIFYDDSDYTSYRFNTLEPLDPVVETPDFSFEERKKAYFRAVVETDQYPLNLKEIWYLVKYSVKYKYLLISVKSFFRQILKYIPKKYKSVIRRISTLIKKSSSS